MPLFTNEQKPMRAHYIISGALLYISAFALAACSPANKKTVDRAEGEGAGKTVEMAAKRPMPGDTVSSEYLAAHSATEFFSANAMPDSVFNLMEGKSYKKDCPVKRSDLRYLTCLHMTSDSCSVMGEMVVATSIAEKVLGILRQLYDAHYPIERMRLIDNYDADDERSMTANNSSGFNFRLVNGTHTVSKHGRGLAVDINPLYNPYCKVLKSGKVQVLPVAGEAYVDRNAKFDYKIERGDLCYRLFKEAGFGWGGDWHTSKDYQHFEFSHK